MTLNRRAAKGWTLIELLVVSAIFSLLLTVVLRLSQSVSQQGEVQDKATTTWTISGQAISLLRNDIANAVAMRKTGDKRLEVDVISIAQDFVQQKSTVIWEQKDKQTICRTENARKEEFSFSQALNRGEEISLRFHWAP